MKPQKHSNYASASTKCNTNWSPWGTTNTTSNYAEHVIQTFKAHFISILVGVDNKFPLSLWCHLLKLTELTLNFLCQSKGAPKVSTFTHVYGSHDYMKKPFALLGCAIQAHIKPEDHRTWDIQLDARFNLGTLMVHHRCFWMYISKTRGIATWFCNHQHITNPMVSHEYYVVVAAQQLALSKAIFWQAVRWHKC
jgi:hypothetical protein